MSHTAKTTSTNAAPEVAARPITRCAVCKVDLKGRFVFVDEGAQRLFGIAGEELFGRQIIDLVDERSRGVINEILSRRNHYETTFDHILLTLVGPGGAPIDTAAIVTLNFNAGNPVNFQFVFNPNEALSASSQPDPEAGRYRHFTEYIADRDITADWRGYLLQLQEFCNARQVCAYIISENHLEHRSSALVGADGVSSLMAIDEPGPLHRFVAQTGEPYDFTDEVAVRRAVELGSAAPNEVIARLSLTEDRQFLIRIIFAPDTNDDSARSHADRTRFALELTQRLAAPPPRPVEDREEDNVQFAVGLLDGLGIGALMTDSRGRIVLYNPTLAELLSVTEVNGDLQAVAQLVAPRPSSTMPDIQSYLQPGKTHPGNVKDLLRVDLPCGRAGTIAYLPLTGNPDDLTAFIAIVPSAHEASVNDLLQFCRTAFKTLSCQAESAAQLVDQIDSRYAGRLGKDGAADVSRLSTSAHEVAGSIQNLGRIYEAAGSAAPAELTDLNIIVHRIANQLNRRQSNPPLRLHTDIMPKITAERRSVTLALENLLTAVASEVDRLNETVRVSASTTDNLTCEVTVAVTTLNRTRGHLFETGLSAARLLLCDIGGNLTERTSDNQTSFILTIPLKSK